KRAAIKARRRRGLASRTTATEPILSPRSTGASVRIATAPRANASGMKRRPSSLAPGRAAKRKPGSTARESAVRPSISVAGGPEPAMISVVPFISSVRRKLLDLYAVDEERAPDIGRALIDRRDAEERGDALHRAPDDGRRGPA